MSVERIRALERARLAIGCAFAALVAAMGCEAPPDGPSEAFLRARTRAAPPEREWRIYLADRGASHYSPLDEIRPANLSRLRVAWTYDARDAAHDGSSQIQCNPLVVKGVLYGTSPTLRLFALDAATGEELWSFEPSADARPGVNPNRGVAYWEEGGDERILFAAGRWLFAVDARTGVPIPSFGRDGRVDLRAGLGPDGARDWVVATTPGAVWRDLLILGGRVSELANAAPGPVRAFDVRSGALRWTFHTIPRPGEPGHETWPPDAWQRVGGANSWAGITLDEARGLAFVPTGSAAFDFYGADRPGDNLFANSLLALDADTGERRWHFQLVHHDVWDRDLPAPPNLVTLAREGGAVDAVAQVTKSGHVFVFERETGRPLFPIEEHPAAPSDLPGEALAARQPLPSRPPPFTRQGLTPEGVTTRTPEARAAVLARLARLRSDGPFAPPSLEGTVLMPGMDGGAEWGGAAFDPGSGWLYVNANEVPYVIQMVETPEIAGLGSLGGIGRAAYVLQCAACHGLDRHGDGFGVPSLHALGDRLGPLAAYRVIRDGRGRMPGTSLLRPHEILPLLWYLWFPGADAPPPPRPADAPPILGIFPRFINAGWAKLSDPEGYPASAPPWGTLTAIDLARGELAWRIPLGSYPELVAQGLPPTGSENYGGPLVTAGGLLFIAATPDEKLRGFDKRTGELLWEAALPAAGFATPATYEAGGRQYLVVAAGGGKLGRPSGSRYVAYALED
jgi:quinoprotein glucose dehydrogenase